MTAIATDFPTHETRTLPHPAVGWWLVGIAGMVFIMVVIGALTRLTDSGLSMVDWRPITGWLPPMTDEAWQKAFDAYRQFPEYQKINAGMSLFEFKEIFWLEFIHRVWGRLIGIAFALPMIFFFVRRMIPAAFAPRIIGLFLLGGAQGFMGWYMVMSGLVDRPDVSQYRLTAHLGLAFVIYLALLWTAFDILRPRLPGLGQPSKRLLGVLALVFLTAMSGGFVAGLDAGFTYNTFPMMDGQLVPPGYLVYDPAWKSLFEDIPTVQFNHRLLATVTGISVLYVGVKSLGLTVDPAARRGLMWSNALVLAQYTLGIATLLSVVAIPLATLHQATALALMTALLFSAHAVRRG
jgi:cytochrome c oxidase assembly protein subunit 15